MVRRTTRTTSSTPASRAAANSKLGVKASQPMSSKLKGVKNPYAK